MLAAQADTTPKTQLKLMLNAWNDLQHTANGYRMIKDETAEKDMITAAQAVRAAISVSTKQQQKDDLEQICSEYWEKAEIMTEKDVLIGLEMYEIVSELALMLGHHRDENAELWYNTARDTAELCVQYGKNTLMTAKIAEASLSIADLYGGTKKLPYLMRAQTDYIKAADTIREQDNKLSAQMNRTVFKIIKEIEHIKKKHRQAVYKGKSRTNSPKDPTIAKKTRKRGRRSKRSERLFKPEHELS